MITFFTTTKKFEGDNKNAQLNAIRSWLKLHEEVEIIIFEKPSGSEFLPKDKRILIVDDPEKLFEIPRVDYMFDYVSKRAKNKFCCFINADIVLTQEFLTPIAKTLIKLSDPFLAVGQRCDFDNINAEWDFSEGWEKRYLYQNKMMLHAATGSDYFLFPAKQYDKSQMNKLIVGRPGWDLWMIYNARKKKILTIDLSPICKVYHQNHDYSHKKVIFENNLDEPESKHNLSFLPAEGKYDFTLYACDYFMNTEFKIRKNFSRKDKVKYLHIEHLLGRNQFISKIKFHIFVEQNNRKN